MSYGCYYFVPNAFQDKKQYLPQVELGVHATILSLNSRTVITQTFVNPSSDPISEVSYVFPLYDRSSIVGFTCSVDDVVLRGCVKSKENADKAYQQAVSMGQSAAILDQSQSESDVFKTRVGNVPAGGTVVVEITLVAELKQDIQTNGPRYTVPNIIAPRYGASWDIASFSSVSVNKTSIKVDIILDKGSVIRSIHSPSHPIQVDIGRASSMAESTFQPCFASAELHENLDLKKDFVLSVTASKPEAPFALLETHPTLPNQRALMVSLMPKFNLAPHAPEIVFVIDRSRSMLGQIPTLKSALEVFLKSLPIGVYFNLVSFGSSHSSLWPRSRSFDEESLQQALIYTQYIQADMGGTEILAPLKAAVERRYKDRDLELLLLTDGQVANQEAVFHFLTLATKEKSTRAFALGIGSSVSHSLVEGIARAGRGFSQVVLGSEKMDAKVVRMLKGSLTSRIQDSFLDVYVQPLGEEFEVIEQTVSTSEEGNQSDSPLKPISLFNDEHTESDIVQTVKEPLPKLTIPAALKAPTELPPLFPFIQSTSYVLLAPSSGPLPEKITLRATSKQGPLELEIPVEDIGIGETIHQLAVKRATLELEEGRGWIQEAKNSQGKLVKEKHESQLSDLIEQECQRLGTRFQVPGKFCSFVAVDETNPSETTPSGTNPTPVQHGFGSMPGNNNESNMFSTQRYSSAPLFPASMGSFSPNGAMRLPSMRPDSSPRPLGTDGAFGPPRPPPKTTMFGGGSAFGAPSAPAFGVSSASAFGASAFGTQSSPSFSKPGASTFGSPSTPAFGAPSPSSFGAMGSMEGLTNSFSSTRLNGSSATPSQAYAPLPSAFSAMGSMPPPPSSSTSSLFGASSPKTAPGGLFGRPSATPGTNPLFGAKAAPAGSAGGSLFGASIAKTAPGSLFGRPSATPGPANPFSAGGFGGFGGRTGPGFSPAAPAPMGSMTGPAGASVNGGQTFGKTNVSQQTSEPDSGEHWTRILIRLQKFDGFWDLDESLLRALSLGPDSTRAELDTRFKRLYGESATLWDHSDIVKILATCLAGICLENKASDSKDVWELVKEKADRWVEKAIESMEGKDQDNVRKMKLELVSLC